MIQFSQLITTQNGQALIAKMMSGVSGVQFTKVCASNTVYTMSQLASLTALSGIKQTSSISNVQRTNNTAVQVRTAFTNADVSTGYYMRTIGLYATDPNVGEILYAVAIALDDNCYMPPYNGVTQTGAYIELVQTVGNASSVSLSVDSGVYATIGDIQELENEIADLKAYIGYSDSDIYGVEVDFKNNKFTRLAGAENLVAGTGFDNINAFGGRKRCILANDGTVLAYQGDAAFTTSGKLTQEVTVGSTTYSVGTVCQVMVEQPKFYYKVVPILLDTKHKGGITRKVRYYVSDTPKTGFKVHPDFKIKGTNEEFNYVYHSAFEGSLWDASASAYILDDSQVADFSADMLCSIANAKPISGLTQNLTKANTRKLAEKRGTGWEQLTVQAASATQLLMLIEYASFNMQTAIANGAVSKTDDGSSNMAENTGATVSLGNKTGAVINDNGIQIVSYRGEENPWGNIWKWVDGINEYMNPTTKEGTVYISDYGFADDSSATPYEDAGIIAVYGSGYISAFAYNEEFDWLFIPGELSGNSSLPVGDYCWNGNTGWRVAELGARWYHALAAGPFYWDLSSDSSYRTRYVSGRLVFRNKAA
jgi:hypothetical protein